MVNGAIRYRLEADDGSQFSVSVSTPHGSQLWLVGTKQTVPKRSGTNALATNDPLCEIAWSFGQTEHEMSTTLENWSVSAVKSEHFSTIGE